jgi:hypothetical protein
MKTGYQGLIGNEQIICHAEDGFVNRANEDQVLFERQPSVVELRERGDLTIDVTIASIKDG